MKRLTTSRHPNSQACANPIHRLMVGYHEIALQQVGPHAPQPPAHGTGLYHIAFEVPDRRSFAEAYRTLKEAGIRVATVDHFISWAMYFDDPDGNGLEIYCDSRLLPSGRLLWLERTHRFPGKLFWRNWQKHSLLPKMIE